MYSLLNISYNIHSLIPVLNKDEGSNESSLSSSETEDVQSKSQSLLDDLDGAYVNLLQVGF